MEKMFLMVLILSIVLIGMSFNGIVTLIGWLIFTLNLLISGAYLYGKQEL